MSILDEIFSKKRLELADRLEPSQALVQMHAAARRAAPPLDFAGALNQRNGRPALIAEIKAASPSRGWIAQDFNPLALSDLYVENGATAISILTDEHYFRGSLDNLTQVRKRHPQVPLLRKDFIFHPYQVDEARTAGADAILLIVAMLDDATLAMLLNQANELGMAVLLETHNEIEVARALGLGARLVGVNNRDLHTFEVNLETSLRLRPLIPTGVKMVAESGIQESEQIARLSTAGVHAILVGEALVGAPPDQRAARIRQFSGRLQP